MVYLIYGNLIKITKSIKYSLFSSFKCSFLKNLSMRTIFRRKGGNTKPEQQRGRNGELSLSEAWKNFYFNSLDFVSNFTSIQII